MCYLRAKHTAQSLIIDRTICLSSTNSAFSVAGIFEPAVFGTTRRGQQKLLHGGHAYTKDRQSSRTCNWKCSLFTRYKCKARAVTREINGIVYVKVTNTLHFHPAEQYKISFRRMSNIPMGADMKPFVSPC